MRRYETFVIIDPDISQDDRTAVIERVKELISQMNGMLILVDEWGDRKLAYEIKKKARGYYVRFDYCAASPLVNEIERFCRIDDRALKYMSVLLEKEADLEQIKEEMEAEQRKREQAAAPPPEPEPQPESTEAESEATVAEQTAAQPQDAGVEPEPAPEQPTEETPAEADTEKTAPAAEKTAADGATEIQTDAQEPAVETTPSKSQQEG